MTRPDGFGTSTAMKCYLLCAVPRCGSWLVADLLEQTDVAGRPEEYFRPDYLKQWAGEWGLPAPPPVGRFVRAALSNTATSNGVFGVKIHWYQLQWLLGELRALPESDPGASDAALLARWFPEPRYVHLYREDTVRQAISYYRATYTDLWFEFKEEDQDAGADQYIRPVQMPDEPDWGEVRYLERAVINHEQHWREFFAQAGIVPLDIRYEDLVAAQQQTLRQVLDFLGVQLPPGAPLPASRLKKQADDETERLVERYLAHRDRVEPREIDINTKRLQVAPQLRGAAPGQPTSSAS
jgi:trehalose 2-sulfotransferase